MKYLRPGNIGLGWGDYDNFEDWQSSGRQLKLELVDKKDWEKDETRPLVFVGEDGTEEAVPAVVVDGFDVDAVPPLTLHEKLRGNRDQGKARGTRGGYTGRSRAR